MQLAEAVGRISQFARGYNLVAAEAMREQCHEIIATAQRKYFRPEGSRRSPTHIVNHTGRLSGAFEVAVTFRQDEIVGKIRNRAPYGYWVLESGTRPHYIRARRAKYLRWFDEQGEIHFAKEVYHPGTDPRPVIAWAAADREHLTARAMATALAEEWKRRVG